MFVLDEDTVLIKMIFKKLKKIINKIYYRIRTLIKDLCLLTEEIIWNKFHYSEFKKKNNGKLLKQQVN